MRRLSVFLVVLVGALAWAGSHAPLPKALMEAKTAYIANETGNAKFADKCYDELSKWGRFKIVDDAKQADIVFRLSTGTHSLGYSAHSTTLPNDPNNSTDTSIREQRQGWTRVDVISTADGQVLWSDSRAWGNMYTMFKSATRRVIKELRKRMEEQEKR